MERERVEKHKKKMIDDEKKVERAAQVRLWGYTPCRHSRSDFTQDTSYKYYRRHKRVTAPVHGGEAEIQGYLAHKKLPPPQGPPGTGLM